MNNSPPAKQASYDRFPSIAVPGGANCCVQGWDDIAARLRRAVAERGGSKTVLAVECYTGVDELQILAELRPRLAPVLAVHAAEAMLPVEKIDRLVEPFLGGDDPVFGRLSGLTLPQFFDPAAVAELRRRVHDVAAGLVLVVGCGATLFCEKGDITDLPERPEGCCAQPFSTLLVYADLARWEGQNRFRRNQASNLGAVDPSLDPRLQYKRAYFVDWRVCDRWKRPLISQWDFVLDTNDPRQPKLAEGEAVRRGLRHAVTRPFRVVPFFDPAPWGGQWMKEVCGLETGTSLIRAQHPSGRSGESVMSPFPTNYGWCFDCVPEENSLLLGLGDARLELPSLDLVFDQPRALLGDAVHARFGDEFPIRFDFLDTMQGGNLSFQVHPLTEYIQQNFGMAYTQDESYYLLDAANDACVYLGLRDGVDPARMVRDLQAAQLETGTSPICRNGPEGALHKSEMSPFPIDAYANRWPAKKHDHFLIPAGTVHCSGRNSMVLEISATPYIFTFKMWDWGRLGLDGRPRPIHLRHGVANIQWERTTDWVRANLINRIVPLGSGDGWREERTGLDEREFIETRRHWFTKPVPHDTGGGVNVLNLVAGDEAIVESPDDAFEPFVVHYAETFIVPAAVGRYTIRPRTPEDECATVKAFVRT